MTSVDSILSGSANGAKVRPGTTGSRAAWQEPRKQELYDGDGKATPEQPVMFGDMGDMPTAMESEVSSVVVTRESVATGTFTPSTPQ